jgi:UPF0271 protein
MLLNLDAGERDDETEGLWSMFDLLNCACGGHAGDARSMDRVAAFCARSTVKLGAHPSYPDRQGFGRRSPLAADAPAPGVERLGAVARLVERAVAEQCRALAQVARQRRVAVVAVKPHGSLYHDAAVRPEIAAALLRGVIDVLGRGVTVIGPGDGALREEAARLRLLYMREGFADRRMRTDGSLVPRGQADALIVDPAEAAAQAAVLAPTVDTICVHADTPGVVDIARAVREAVRG